MKTGRPPILEKRCKEVTGRTMAEYFESAIGTRVTIQSMAKVLDVSPSTICNWAKANGKKWDTPPKSNLKFYGFEWKGFHGTQRAHCNHHGVCYETAKAMAHRYKIPFVDALAIQISKKNNPPEVRASVKARIKALGISYSNVRMIAKEYGIDMQDAQEIALIRKQTREAAKAEREAV